MTSPTQAFGIPEPGPREIIDPALDVALAKIPDDDTRLETDLTRFRLYIAAVDAARATFVGQPCLPDSVCAAYTRMVYGPYESSAQHQLTQQEFDTVHYADQERRCGLAGSMSMRVSAGIAYT